MDAIIAVRVALDSGESRYFLTWGRLGQHVPWPGDIERAVLRAAHAYALGGTAVSAKVCDSLQQASGERYFYECLVSMQAVMPHHDDPRWNEWTATTVEAVQRGRQLYYCGMPEEREAPPDPAARHGYRLIWWPPGSDDDGPAGEVDLPGLTAERVQAMFGDEDIDRVMFLEHRLDGNALGMLAREYGVAMEPERFEYYLCPWADPGFRTPGGYSPPPPT